MTEKINPALGDVQKTLFLPLWGRAHETRKAMPLLVDKTALVIIEQVDLDLDSLADKMNPLSQVAWIMRSNCTDRVITQFLEKHPRASIVNIGCGLDTTFERVDNGQVLWYDLDLPDVIALRQKFIPAGGRRKSIAASFLDDGWLAGLEVHDHILFIAAGVFYYFEAAQVKGFLQALAGRFPGAEILFDVASPTGVRTANRLVIQSAGLDKRSFLKWGLKNPRELLAWDERFELVQRLYYFRDKRLDLRTRLMGAFSDLLGIQYMLHLRLGRAG